MKTKFFLTFWMIIAVISTSYAQSEILEQDVTYTLASVRTWTSFDGNAPADEPYENWAAGGPYKNSFHRFTADQKVAQGKFVEFLIWFDNKGTEDNSIEMIHSGDSIPDCQLLYGQNQHTIPNAFLIPGLGIAKDKCLIEIWNGILKFNLKSKEKTWLLLLFDVPNNVSEAKLQLKATTPVSVKIP